ncbi:hypothetical protein [Mycobacterium hubeiense]|uniref:hypothetical protein n=1 Tax=Mycobacterium hubeiense TaxID=1867256 RepID=UPI000C7F5F68|nr:hypothetical protein [Mycobacterium sp. QGD 101]
MIAYKLICDDCPYAMDTAVSDNSSDTATAAREYAHAQGWITRDDRDICPRCALDGADLAAQFNAWMDTDPDEREGGYSSTNLTWHERLNAVGRWATATGRDSDAEWAVNHYLDSASPAQVD